mmetsp:Transcript_10896/g.30477  ORF Transcript_10896/g.30477 Transcript_10896/m.30477 type:complete len:233 (-) Transcript_10896:712-1410(-)
MHRRIARQRGLAAEVDIDRQKSLDTIEFSCTTRSVQCLVPGLVSPPEIAPGICTQVVDQKDDQRQSAAPTGQVQGRVPSKRLETYRIQGRAMLDALYRTLDCLHVPILDRSEHEALGKQGKQRFRVFTHRTIAEGRQSVAVQLGWVPTTLQKAPHAGHAAVEHSVMLCRSPKAVHGVRIRAAHQNHLDELIPRSDHGVDQRRLPCGITTRHNRRIPVPASWPASELMFVYLL